MLPYIADASKFNRARLTCRLMKSANSCVCFPQGGGQVGGRQQGALLVVAPFIELAKDGEGRIEMRRTDPAIDVCLLCREVAKWVRVGKARAVVVAPNIEPVEGEAGLSALLAGILSDARERGVPAIFALSRKRMGQVGGHINSLISGGWTDSCHTIDAEEETARRYVPCRYSLRRSAPAPGHMQPNPLLAGRLTDMLIS